MFIFLGVFLLYMCLFFYGYQFPVKEYPTDLVESLLEALSAPTSRPVTVICLSKLLLELASSIGSRNVFHFRHFEILMVRKEKTFLFIDTFDTDRILRLVE